MSGLRTADNLLRFPGEAPLQAQLKDWIDDTVENLGDEYGAAFAGTDPFFCLDYALFPMDTIPALVANAAADISPSMVMRRDEARASKEFDNNNRLLKRNEHMAKWRNSLFCKLKLTMSKSAPLLLQRLQALPGVAIAGHPGWYSGSALFVHLRALRNAGTDEDFIAHDNVLEWIKYNPLPAGCTSAKFTDRVNDFRLNHAPFLERPMTDVQLGKRIIKMMPDALGPDGRRIEEAFELAGTLDDHPALVAACSKVIGRACTAPQVAGGTAPKHSESLAVLSIMAATGGASPFRPGGTRGRTPTNTDARTSSSKPLPAGETNPNWDSKCPSKTCHIPHQGACFSDPSNANISHALFTNAKALGRIDTRRKANAKRLNVSVVKWIVPAPGAAAPAKSVNSLTMLDVQARGQRTDVTPSLLVMSVNENAQCASDSDAEMPTLLSGSDSDDGERASLSNSIAARAVRAAQIMAAKSSNEATNLMQAQTIADVHIAALEGRVARMQTERAQAKAAFEMEISTAKMNAAAEKDAAALAALDDIAPPIIKSVPAPTVPAPSIPPPSITHVFESWRYAVIAALILLACIALSTAHNVAAFALVVVDSVAMHLRAASASTIASLVDTNLAVWHSPADMALFSAMLTLLAIFVWGPNVSMLARQSAAFAKQHATRIVVLLIVYMYTARVSSLQPGEVSFVFDLVHANQSDVVIMRHFQYAQQLDTRWSNNITLPESATAPFNPSICLFDLDEIGVSSTLEMIVGDSGAAKDVLNKTRHDQFHMETCRACEFTVNSASGHGCTPEFIGDATFYLIQRDGSTLPLLRHDVLYIPECPHCLLSLGVLCTEGHSVTIGFGDADSFLNMSAAFDGVQVPLLNRGITVFPSPPTQNIMLAGDGKFKNSTAPLTTNPVAPPETRNCVFPVPSKPVRFAHWFSGDAGRVDGMAKFACDLGAETAYEFDKSLGHDLTNDDTFYSALADIDTGRITAAHFGVPCNTFTVLRFMGDPRWNVLRTCDDITGLPNFVPRRSASR